MAAGRDLGATARMWIPPAASARSRRSLGVRKPWGARRDQGDVVKNFIDGERSNLSTPGEWRLATRKSMPPWTRPTGTDCAWRARTQCRPEAGPSRRDRLVGHANYLDDEAVELLASRNEPVYVGPAIAWEVQYVKQCESLGVSPETVRAQGYEAEIEATVKTVEKLREAEVKLVVGGDYGISIAPHGTYAKDLEYFVDLFDMRPAEALVCATRNGGEAMDRSGSLGTLQAGTKADVVVVDGDPLRTSRIAEHAGLP